MINLHY